jgi:translation initiation factor 2B subunit (eIF-2B alpha/beta/delta family)
MHPIERLRMVARTTGEDPTLVAQEAADVLGACADDPAGLVTACRRLVDHHPTSGTMWWLAARVLAAPDAQVEAWRAAEELRDDPTAAALAVHLPDDAVVTVVGWADQVADALRRRGDVGALVIDAAGTGGPLASHLRRAGSDATAVPESGLGAATAASGLVLLEAMAMGPDGFVAMAGSRAAAAVARQEDVPVWLVAGVGRVLPAALWTALLGRLAAAGDPWEAEEEVVPIELVDQVVGPEGPAPPDAASRWATCPVVPELTRTGAAPGSRRPDGGGRGPS